MQGPELKSFLKEKTFFKILSFDQKCSIYSTFYGILVLQMLQIYIKKKNSLKQSNHITTTQLENYACETMRFENLPLIIQFSLAHLA